MDSAVGGTVPLVVLFSAGTWTVDSGMVERGGVELATVRSYPCLLSCVQVRVFTISLDYDHQIGMSGEQQWAEKSYKKKKKSILAYHNTV